MGLDEKFMGLDGVAVCFVPSNWRTAGSNPPQARAIRRLHSVEGGAPVKFGSAAAVRAACTCSLLFPDVHVY